METHTQVEVFVITNKSFYLYVTKIDQRHICDFLHTKYFNKQRKTQVINLHKIKKLNKD